MPVLGGAGEHWLSFCTFPWNTQRQQTSLKAEGLCYTTRSSSGGLDRTDGAPPTPAASGVALHCQAQKTSARFPSEVARGPVGRPMPLSHVPPHPVSGADQVGENTLRGVLRSKGEL